MIQEYYSWLRGKVIPPGTVLDREWYAKNGVLITLDSITFSYLRPMDAARFEDGIALRYRFGNECGYTQFCVANTLDLRPCSVLEALVALAIRIDSIMGDPREGDSTAVWFWRMIQNMLMTDVDGIKAMFDADSVDLGTVVTDAATRFVTRTYRANGAGGNVFVTRDPRVDLRGIDIWDQMCLYTSSLISAQTTTPI